MSLCSAWITAADLVDCGCDTGDLNPGTIGDLLMAATEWMYDQTGQRYPGLCEVTERPCGCGCGCGLLSTGWANINGYGPAGGCCNGICGCSAEAAVKLTYGPVTEAEVTIDGEPFTDFVIVQPNLLVRTDGGEWPSCQSYVDGWTVTYTYGSQPPTLVRLGAQDLVQELVKACPGGPGGECSLPSDAVSITRRGVTFTMDSEQVGKGLPRVALALSAFGRKGQTDLVIPGRRGLVISGPSVP